MKPGKADFVRIVLFLLFSLATVPAYCQRGTVGIDVGQVSDQFASFPPVTAALLDVNGEVTVKQASAKNGGPSIVAGGEVRVPSDSTTHAHEWAFYGGLAFAVHGNWSIGVDGQIRKIYMPVATVGDQVFPRNNMELFQLPLVVKYKFGPAKRAFFEARGEPEFTPRFRNVLATEVQLPKPGFDHGYTLRGSVGYTFNKWYFARASYETRYFKFAVGPGNPNNLYNWKSNVISGGVGLNF
jgi:hypothetical protein